MKNLQATLDRVLVEDIETPNRYGLIIVRNDPTVVDSVNGDYRHAMRKGRVLSVGPGKYDDEGDFHPTEVKPGQIITFTDWNDAPFIGEGLRLIQESDIWWIENA